MTKKSKPAEMTVTDPKTGKVFVVRGIGSMKDHKLELIEGIDLTKPIAEQVFALKTFGKD